MANPQYEPIIIGGGPAGQSAALIAGQIRIKTALIIAENPRNFVTAALYGFLTRDSPHLNELSVVAKEQICKFPPVDHITDRIFDVARSADGFSATTARGTTMPATHMLIATGHRDHLNQLKLPVIEVVYSKTVYPYPFCDGYEHADEAFAIFDHGAIRHLGPMMRIWSRDMIMFTNGKSLDAKVKAELQIKGFLVKEVDVAGLWSSSGALTHVTLDDGREIARQSGFVVEELSSPATDVAERLGGVAHEETNWGMPEVSGASGATNIPGPYLVGDARIGFAGIAAVISEGSFRGAMEHWTALPEEAK